MKKLYSKKKNKINILVIGGTGFIGKYLIEKLPKDKFNIFSLSKKVKRKIKRIKNVNYIFCDISKKEELYNKLDKYNFETVVNLSGHVNHSEWKKTYNSHFIGTKNLSTYFVKKKIKNFIQMSSSLEYSKNRVPHTEKMKINLEKLKTAYSLAKAKSTKYLLKLNKKDNFPVTILRLYLAYGPKQEPNRIVPIAIKKFLLNKKIKLSDCMQVRDFLYIDDLINLLMKIISSKKSKKVIFNVGSGKPIILKFVIEYLRNKIKKGKPEYGKLSLRKDEAYKFYPNISLVKKTFKWTPKTKLEDGLTKTVNFFKNENKKSIS